MRHPKVGPKWKVERKLNLILVLDDEEDHRYREDDGHYSSLIRRLRGEDHEENQKSDESTNHRKFSNSLTGVELHGPGLSCKNFKVLVSLRGVLRRTI